jgi:hypothetical protein
MLRAAAFLAATLAFSAAALESTTWPPPEGVAERMQALQGVISDAQSTSAQREAAREELSALLKSPAGQARGRTADEKPARAAIQPFGPIVKPVANPPISVPGVATVEVIVPPKISISPRSGTPAIPAGPAAVDPRTGHILHDTGNGFVDPRTGQFIPK